MKVKLPEWRELIDVDLPPVGPITAETRKHTLEEARKFRGSIRISTGRFWTDEEFEEYRRRVLSTPLP